MQRAFRTGTILAVLTLATAPSCRDTPARETETEMSEAQQSAGVKGIALFSKRDDVSWEEFERYYLNDHVPFVRAIPGLRRWVANVVVHGEERSPYDGVGEFWFDDQAAFDRAMASPEVAATLRDAENFVASPGPIVLVVREHALVTNER